MSLSKSQLRSLVGQARQCIPREPTPQPSSRPFAVDFEDREALTRWMTAPATTERVAVRSVVVLLADAGWTNARIAIAVGVTRRTVALWKVRYRHGGVAAILTDAPGRGRKPGRDATAVARILAATTDEPPPGNRWTVRSLARAIGVSHATVQRVWREHGVTPLLRDRTMTAAAPSHGSL